MAGSPQARPWRKQAHIDQLHSKDMENGSLCELKGFGETIAVKQVRDRAIGERIEAISQSTSLKIKFEKEWAVLKKK